MATRSSVFVCVFLVSLTLSGDVAARVLANQEITCQLHYKWFWNIGANWSTTSRKSDWSSEYAIVRDFTVYAPTIEKFIQEYPVVTVETIGEAISLSTFGDVGRGKFGTWEFETALIFKNSTYLNNYKVSSSLNHITFDVGVEIGVGFKIVGNTLYLRPFTNGWMYSVGMTWRYLEFGLQVSSVTFHPKDERKSAIIYSDFRSQEPIEYDINYSEHWSPYRKSIFSSLG